MSVGLAIGRARAYGTGPVLTVARQPGEHVLRVGVRSADRGQRATAAETAVLGEVGALLDDPRGSAVRAKSAWVHALGIGHSRRSQRLPRRTGRNVSRSDSRR